MKLLIQNGEIVSGDGVENGWILVDGSVIAAVGRGLDATAAHERDIQVLDASGCLVFPGFIDTHTHLDMEAASARTADNFESATRAAILGGTTAILDFATQARDETLSRALADWRRLAAGNCACDYGFHMAVTDWNPGVAAEIPEMTKAGVVSYKVYMAYEDLRLGDGDIYEILTAARKEAAIVGCHCENGDLVNAGIRHMLAAGCTGPEAHPRSRPDLVEAEAIDRFLSIASLADCTAYVVHLSTSASMDAMRRFRSNGKVYAETCPQYLMLDESRYEASREESVKCVMSPPLRKGADREALWTAASNGEIDFIGTDHCAFALREKLAPFDSPEGDFSMIPNGAPGVGFRAQLIYTYGVLENKISLPAMCRLLSENPAKIFGMYPKKGVLAPGSDADIVIWEKDRAGVISPGPQNGACGYTPFEGFNVKGAARDVFLRGERVVANGALDLARANAGQYIFRARVQQS